MSEKTSHPNDEHDEPNSGSKRAAMFTYLLSILLLAVVIGFGTWVNCKTLIVADLHTNGYSFVNVDTAYWNVACTVIGTIIGLIAALAFSIQDDHITRHELASNRGAIAMFLRPLSMRRGWEQFLHLQFQPERTLLLILTIVATALMSAATVALFGIRSVPEEIINEHASFPLSAMSETFFSTTPKGGLLGTSPPNLMDFTSQLTGFLYRAAYIEGKKLRGRYEPLSVDNSIVPEAGLIGDTLYSGLNTGGVGLNTSSYMQYIGLPVGFNMPSRYEFSSLSGTVYGTHVNVSCRNITSEYTFESFQRTMYCRDVTSKCATDDSKALVPLESTQLLRIDDFEGGKSSRPAGPNFTIIRRRASGAPPLSIASTIRVDPATQIPTHFLAVPDDILRSVFVLACTYSGQEYMAQISVPSAVSPLQLVGESDLGPILSPYRQQRLANMSLSLLEPGDRGGNLAQGFYDAEFNDDGSNNTHMAKGVETVLSQLGEAYLSVMRQHVERSNVHTEDRETNEANGSHLRMMVRIQRLGGGQLGWLAVPGVLLLGSILGTVQLCRRRKTISFNAQDSVSLLQKTLKDPSIKNTTRLRYHGCITVAQMEDTQERVTNESNAAATK